MVSDERSTEVYKLLDNINKNLVSQDDKEKIAKIIDSLDMGTFKQKLRFKTVYRLQHRLPKFETLSAYARFEGCNVNAIRSSIATLRNRLINHSTEDDINCIKEINKKIEEK